MNNGCKLCSKGVGTEPGLSQREIASKYGVARSSVQRHLKHLGQDKEEVKPKDPFSSRSVLDISGSKGTAEVSVNQDLDEFFADRGIDPNLVEITSRKISEWEVNTLDGIKLLKSQKVSFNLQKTSQVQNIEDLFDSIDRSRADRKYIIEPEKDSSQDGLVVLWADPQTGKVDRNGGTAELIERIYEKRDKLYSYIQNNPAKSAHFLNLGDSVENIQNTSAQLGTNDLSLTDQISQERKLEHLIIDVLAATHDDVSVNIVPSNHCQLRQGKGLIGTPGDDWGINITQQLEFAYSLNPDLYSHVRFNYPVDKWIESMVVDVEGVKIGMVHGHQKTQPDGIPLWWAKQVHGGILHEAELLVTGHFHHFILRNTGVHINTGRPKYHIQAPALDNGSSWFQNISGESAEAGLVVFRVNQDGFIVGSLDIL